MTSNESFKKRVRARMAQTGERYNAARRVLLEQAARRPATWVSDPEVSDDAVLAATGRRWDDWRTLLDAESAGALEHPAIARHLSERHGLDGWWSQTVTVGYERITGRRLPGQMPDGTFSVSVSRTIPGSADRLRAMLEDDGERSDLFGGATSERRSRPGVKAPRVAIGPGVATISVTAKGADRMTVSVQHRSLPDPDDRDRWRHFWADWLDALAST